MLFFILKRILRWIPSLILIVVASFLLCYHIPNRAQNEEENMDASSIVPQQSEKPVFYFILQSYQWDPFIYEYEQDQYALVRLLYSYCGDEALVNSFVTTLEQVERSLQQDYKAQLISSESYKESILSLQKLIDVSSIHEIELKEKVLQDILYEIEFHENAWKRNIPYIHWIGKDNLFNDWLQNILKGTWGYSKHSRQPIFELIKKAFIPTIRLALIALILALLVIPLSIFLFQSKAKWTLYLQQVLRVVSSIPKFIWALFLMLFFVAWLQWMDPLIFKQIQRGNSQAYLWYVLPALAMIFPYAGYLQDQIFQQLTVEYKKAYVQTAFAKGMDKRQVLYRHVLKNSLFPFITSYTQLIPLLLGGSVLVERIFGIPGIGDLMVEAIYNGELELIVSITFILSIIISFSYLLGDILYQIINPKVTIE